MKTKLLALILILFGACSKHPTPRDKEYFPFHDNDWIVPTPTPTPAL